MEDSTHLLRGIKPGQRLILVDADDTLWDEQGIYEGAKRRFEAVVAKEGLDPAYTLQRMEDVDVASAKKVGFEKTRFGKSMAEAYRSVCVEKGLIPKEDVVKELFDIGFSVHSAKRILYPEAEGVLKRLRADGRNWLVLLSAGDRTTQDAKLSGMGLGDLFDEIVVVERKTQDVYRSFVDYAGCVDHPASVFMVGNSLQSDILPALQVGLSVVYIPRDTWGFERGGEERLAAFGSRYHTTENLEGVEGIIAAAGGSKNVTKTDMVKISK